MCLLGFLVWVMRKQNIIRAFCFVVFFSIGATAMYISIICGELVGRYHKSQLLKAKQEGTTRLKSLNVDYDALLQQLRKDPNLVKRVAPAVLGTEPADANTIYPKATAEQLAAVRRALMEDLSETTNAKKGVWEPSHKVVEPMIPDWLDRCGEPRRRIILFLAGAFLILISFVWFGRVKEVDQKGVKEISQRE